MINTDLTTDQIAVNLEFRLRMNRDCLAVCPKSRKTHYAEIIAKLSGELSGLAIKEAA